MADPLFIETDSEQVLSEIKDFLEVALNKTLQPGSAEMVIATAWAYRESLIRVQIQEAAKQNLVSFSIAPVLDYLGELVGVVRLAASPAKCTLRFDLVSGHTGVTIPAGTRVQSSDGKVVFATDAAEIVIAGDLEADVEASCLTTGEIGNNYAIGDISILLDPQAFIVSPNGVENIEITAGGADQESDEELRDRIKLAPSQFSNAGSTGAYKFHSKGANPSIIDVAVISPNPGQVAIYPLMFDGSVTPQTVLDEVYAACNDEKVRPLTDTVNVYSPTRVDYTLAVDLTLYNDADGTLVTDDVTAAVQAFIDEKRQSLGQDIVGTQVIAVCQIPGVYEVVLTGFSDIDIAETEFGFCTGFVVSIVGTTNG